MQQQQQQKTYVLLSTRKFGFRPTGKNGLQKYMYTLVSDMAEK
jgi:hypothetical protein